MVVAAAEVVAPKGLLPYISELPTVPMSEKCDTTLRNGLYMYNPSAICCDISVGGAETKQKRARVYETSAWKKASDNSLPSEKCTAGEGGRSLTMFSTVNKDLYR